MVRTKIFMYFLIALSTIQLKKVIKRINAGILRNVRLY